MTERVCPTCGPLPSVPPLTPWQKLLLGLIAPEWLSAVSKATCHAVHLLEERS